MKKLSLIFVLAIITVLINGCASQEQNTAINRSNYIPQNAVKMSPANDSHPPILHSNEWEKPVLAPGLVNSAGAEDSPFITPDGNVLYFFFTPDVKVPVEKQVIDGVTGIYFSKKVDGIWQEPERIFLEKKGKAVLDGCEFILNDKMWFCSTREGYTGINWFTAEYKDNEWKNWKEAKFNASYEVGELHITSDGNELYFHSPRAGGKGQYDIWVSKKLNNEWQEPTNLSIVNTGEMEGWPFVSENQQELWFLRYYKGTPAIYRSKKENKEWQTPELIISQFAGEPSLDNEGNIYFVHHYYKNGEMIEADLYIAKKK